MFKTNSEGAVEDEIRNLIFTVGLKVAITNVKMWLATSPTASVAKETAQEFVCRHS